jgi:hypothetical protein
MSDVGLRPEEPSPFSATSDNPTTAPPSWRRDRKGRLHFSCAVCGKPWVVHEEKLTPCDGYICCAVRRPLPEVPAGLAIETVPQPPTPLIGYRIHPCEGIEWSRALALWQAALAEHRAAIQREREAEEQRRQGEIRRLGEEALKRKREAAEVRRTHLCLADLKRRGWTDAEVRSFLGDPDATAPNPHYGNAPPLCLYRPERVEAAQQSPEYQEFHQRGARRREAARQTAAKRKALATQVESLAMRSTHRQPADPAVQRRLALWDQKYIRGG